MGPIQQKNDKKSFGDSSPPSRGVTVKINSFIEFQCAINGLKTTLRFKIITLTNSMESL